MESCIRISLSENIDPDQAQRFDHSGRNEIWREPFPPARTCDKIWPVTVTGFYRPVSRLAGKCNPARGPVLPSVLPGGPRGVVDHFV